MKGTTMKIKECLVGQSVIIHKPKSRASGPYWVNDMDMFDGCYAIIISKGPLYVSLDNNLFPAIKHYVFDPRWLSPYQEYKPAGIEGLL